MATERSKIRYELERKRDQEDRKVEAMHQAGALRDQMDKLRLREQEVCSFISYMSNRSFWFQQHECIILANYRYRI